MATISLRIFKAKVLKDGNHKIRIAISHHHVTNYIVTRFVINENQFKNGRVVKHPDANIINAKLLAMMAEYQQKIDNIPNIDSMTCTQVKNILQCGIAQNANNTFKSVCDGYLKELEEEGRGNYATLLERNCRYFIEYMNGDVRLADINPLTIEGYARHLKIKRKLSDTTVSMMMARTKTIINRGVKHQLVKYDVHPFINYKITSAPVKELDISLDSFNKIRLADLKEHRLRVARDLFVLSFYLGGINLIDLLQIDFRGCERIEYIRTKSRNTTNGTKMINIAIPDVAKPIIKEWMNRNTGRLDFGYKFSYPNFSRYMSRSLARLSDQLNINEHVVYYSARKSFAQYASELGITDGIIDYCLGHSDGSKGVIRYYTKIRSKQADMAIKKVIDYVNNPSKYEDYIELRNDIMMMR